MLLAHEFFDALPIHILQRSQDGFREVRVARNPSYLPVANNARFSLAVDREQSLLSQLLPAASKRFSALPTGSQMEISPDSSRIVRSAARLMKAGGGAALVVDYGDDRVFANSFRAFREHKIVNIFDKPGSSDLTANVDFAYLRESLEDIATAFGPVPQGKFLLSMGLEPRLEKLVAAATDAETTERIRKGAKRLIDTTGMGSQYQVMGFGVGPASEGEVYPFPPPKPAPAPPTPAPASSPADSTPRAGGAPTSGSKL
jgi:NADH dehydrogenase [ubiquinone] 1 alpha subcomplex assembly factor 7